MKLDKSIMVLRKKNGFRFTPVGQRVVPIASKKEVEFDDDGFSKQEFVISTTKKGNLKLRPKPQGSSASDAPIYLVRVSARKGVLRSSGTFARVLLQSERNVKTRNGKKVTVTDYLIAVSPRKKDGKAVLFVDNGNQRFNYYYIVTAEGSFTLRMEAVPLYNKLSKTDFPLNPVKDDRFKKLIGGNN